MDQDRPIEKLLGRAAKRRREQAAAPFEMHSATRRMLKGEVERTFPPARQEGAARGFLAFISLHRFAVGAGALAVIVLAAFLISSVIHHSPNAQTFAQNNEPEILKQPNAAPAHVVQADSEQRADRAKRDSVQEFAAAENRPNAFDYKMKDVSPQQPSADGLKKEQLADKLEKPAETTAAPAVAANDFRAPSGAGAGSGLGGGAFSSNIQPASPDLAQNELMMRSRRLAAPASVPSPASPAASAPVGGLAAADQGQLGVTPPDADLSSAVALNYQDATLQGDRSFMLRQQPQSALFLNKVQASTLAARQTNQTNSVLSSFRVERQGDSLRVVDYDGSVYSGSLLPAPTRYGLSVAAQGSSRPAPANRFQEQTVTSKAAPPLASVTETGAPLAAGLPFFMNFRVTGTNRTLNQPLIFTGTITPGATNFITSNRGANTGAAPALSGWLGNATVAGRAVLNNSQQFEIQATAPPSANPANTNKAQ